jgi:GT2 family glycosyltransferase
VLIDNPKKYVSYGFNKAFAESKGKYIGLLGAHTYYPKSYYQSALQALETEDCDVVGGPLLQVGKGSMGKAIAYCMSTKMGVGNTAFRTSKKKQYVDSVAFAIYKRTVFEKVGLLDTELVRNQDDELHYRINANGFKILMIPEMQCEYQVRDSIPKLFRQYYEYGVYKPLVLKKVKSGIKLRHLVPALFVSYLISLPIAIFYPIWLLPGLLYLLMALFFSFNNQNPIAIKINCFAVYPVLHFSYGAGFLLGLSKII